MDTGEDEEEADPTLLVSIAHPNGVNSVLPCAAQNGVTVYVADSTETIARYDLPP